MIEIDQCVQSVVGPHLKQNPSCFEQPQDAIYTQSLLEAPPLGSCVVIRGAKEEIR